MGSAVESDPTGAKAPDTHVEQAYNADVDEKQKAMDNKADAMEAEQAELNLGVIDGVKAYPMAALWAFIMSCTIVCSPFVCILASQQES